MHTIISNPFVVVVYKVLINRHVHLGELPKHAILYNIVTNTGFSLGGIFHEFFSRSTKFHKRRLRFAESQFSSSTLANIPTNPETLALRGDRASAAVA